MCHTANSVNANNYYVQHLGILFELATMVQMLYIKQAKCSIKSLQQSQDKSMHTDSCQWLYWKTKIV